MTGVSAEAEAASIEERIAVQPVRHGLPSVRPDPFVGRDAELADLQRFVDDAAEPVLLLTGPRGSGRTRMLRELHRSRARTTVLVRSRTTAEPWSGMSAVLDALGLAAGSARRTEHGDGAAPEETERPARRLVDAFRDREPSVVVLIDDADLLDDDSREALLAAADQLDGSPVRLLLAMVQQPAHPPRRELVALHLAPLSGGEARSLGSMLTTDDVDRATVGLTALLSGGVPGVLAAQLARLTGAQRSGRVPLTVPLPPAYPNEAVPTRARYALDDADRRVLRWVSTAPAMSVGALPALVGAHLDRIEPLIARGLLMRESGLVSVPLPELRSALYWELSPADRAAAHAAAARAEQEAGDADLRDWHASQDAAAPPPSPALYAAATSMLRKGQAAGALELAERALGLAAAGAPAQQQLEFARELLLHGFEELTARHLPRDRTAVTRRQVFQRVRLELVARALLSDDLGMDAVDAVVGRFRTDLPDECADLLALAGVLLVMDGALEEGLWRIRAAGVLAPPDATGHALSHWADRLAMAVRGESEPGAGHARVPAEADVETRMAAALALMWEERAGAAREHIAIISGAGSGARSLWSMRALGLAVENELRAGEPARAAELAARLEAAPGRRSVQQRIVLAAAWIEQCRFAEAAALLDSCERVPGHPRRLHRHALSRLRAAAALLQGDLGTAIELLRSVAETTADLNPAVLRCLPDLAEAQWRAGDDDGARATVDRLAEGVARWPSAWGSTALRRCRAMLARDVDAAFVGVIATDGVPLPFERARTHALWCLAAQRAGLPDRAAEQRAIAIEAFDRIGAAAWSELLRGEGPSFRGVASLPALTDQELAVLRLARRGAHNREIAAALFLSLRSVELRFTSIYRKFGASSRAHLFLLLPEGYPEDGSARR